MNNKTEPENSTSQIIKTDGGKTKSNAIEIPSISLPRGGGAIKSIDEKFSVNAVNGSALFSVPLPFSPARGATPALSLQYNSGSGNGLFGLGWDLSLSSIKRKTDNGLPQYTDSDIFLFSETEDLVPEFKKEEDGSFSLDSNDNYIIKKTISPDGFFTITFFRPRIEGLFARIEQWTHNDTDEIKWRVITKNNITTLFGWNHEARISDPKNQNKIFKWLPEFIFDDKGNCSHYIYKKENSTGIDPLQTHNKNRINNGVVSYTNLYLSKVLYGNKTPYKNFGDAFLPESDYFFQTVFDYGEYNTDAPYTEIKDWDFRKDAFSVYKPGFEIRTTRLCTRVLLFHYFSELPGGSALIKSINFLYDTHSESDFTFLKSMTVSGYIKKPDGTYSCKNLPSMDFEYEKHNWNKDIKSIALDDLVHSPAGLNEPEHLFNDLFNEGLAGILIEQGNGWFYKHNLGDGKFEQAKKVSPKPSVNGLGQLQLLNLEADGSKQLVQYNSEPKGFFELSDEDEWHPFHTFENMPNIEMNNANARMIDLNGDGRPDILVTEDHVFSWYQSTGKKGYKSVQTELKEFDEESGPHIVFADYNQSIFLADMSGDGLTDIVRIRNKEICYWPNLGYGKFGKKINMDNAPLFDNPGSFNPSQLRLADIDGSGTTDIIYLGKNKCTCWKNLSGNRFSIDPFEIDTFPEIHNGSKITVTDLLGNGVACIVWSSNLTKDSRSPLKYIDIMDSKKPHILISYKNNMGKEVSLQYRPSTKYYIDDKLSGRPWVTKLHFPVHCVSKTITTDKISGYKFIHEYKYHHGYYDHPEKEFRGFGMVEQIDAETFEHWHKGNASNIVEEPLHQEPVVTKTWFHTGAFLQDTNIQNRFSEEHWHEEIKRKGFSVTHPEIDLPEIKIITAKGIDPSYIEHLSVQEWQEIYRTYKGTILRSEIFAKDASKFGNTDEARKKELTPFSVSANCFVVELLQPKGKNKHAVFIVKKQEAITYNYERNPEDPRITHALNVKFDDYGNVLESASVVYPRSVNDDSLPSETQQQQSTTITTYTRTGYTNDVISDTVNRLRLISEVETFELKGVIKSGKYYSPGDFNDILSNTKSDTALYHEIDKPLVGSKTQKRLIEHIRSTYYQNDLSGPLPLRQLESLALPYESFQLAYTPELISDIYDTKVDAPLLTEGRFTHSEGDNNWWIRSGTTQYIAPAENANHASDRFYSPISYTDPYSAITKVQYYNDYFLFIEETEDALQNKTKVGLFNFRTLSPQRMIDINNNISEVVSDELGLVKAVAAMGKGNQADDLAGINEFTDITETTLIADFFTTPKTPEGVTDSVSLHNTGRQLLNHATTRFVYDFDAYKTNGKPAVAAAITREVHFRKPDGTPNTESNIQIKFEYSNGLGEVVMKKIPAEPGIAGQVVVQSDNSYIATSPNPDTSTLSPKQLRWIGNGRTIKNNKGNAVKQYEPYFSVTCEYEDCKELVESGVTPVMHYDAIGRLIKTEMPDSTFSKIEFDSWKKSLYDANDTILKSSWYTNRSNRLIDAQLNEENKDPVKEKEAADKAAKHANTPNTFHYDTLGRPILSVEHNKDLLTDADEYYYTKVSLDAEGNLRDITDARNNTVMQYKYDMLGNKVFQNSMDAGKRWLLINVAGKPLRTWDERDHEFQYFYDALQRPIHSIVIGGDGDTPLNNIFDRLFYGETETDPELKNLRGQVIKHYDTGGLIDTPEYDFKGQPISTTRRLFKNYKSVANWTDANLNSDLEVNPYTFITKTDALGRITEQTAPDGAIITPLYNETGLLNTETILHPGSVDATVYIKDINYNEKGQREKIEYGNNVTTRFYYDRETFRVKQLESKRKNGDPLQDWHYTYDPVGNITHIEDKNIPDEFCNNQIITGLSTYKYDALYRLKEATGRENDAAINFGACDNWNDKPYLHAMNPGDKMKSRSYTQSYYFDEVGNITEMKHIAPGGRWTRTYNYEQTNNRLISTHIKDNGNPADYTTYKHHAKHGFLEELPHLEKIGWNFKEEAVLTTRQHCTEDNIPVITYYQYDGGGQRIRKITENQSTNGSMPSKKEERIYVAGYELYIKHTGEHKGLKRTTISLLDEGHRFVMIETRNEEVDDGTELQLVRYQLHNHLGSAALELDGTPEANILSYEEYHPFGTTAYQANNAAIKAAAKRYRYTGMERDEETGLEYHSARYYLPWLGRWLSCDPLGIVDSTNLFIYSKNNPINLSDNTGKHPFGGLEMQAQRRGKIEKQISENRQRFIAIRGRKTETEYEFNGKKIMEVDNAALTLVRSFRDTQIKDKSSSVSGRLDSIIEIAKSEGLQGEIIMTFNKDTIRGTGDTGFRYQFQDLKIHPGSGDQIGHFLGAVRAGHSFPSSVAWNQMLAHEFESEAIQSDLLRLIDSNLSVTPQDISNFRSGNLDKIPLDTSQFGVSYQDLYLTYFGLRFAEMVDQGKFASIEEAAKFLEILLTPVDLSTRPKDEITSKFSQEISEIQRMLTQFEITQTEEHKKWRESELQKRAQKREQFNDMVTDYYSTSPF